MGKTSRWIVVASFSALVLGLGAGCAPGTPATGVSSPTPSTAGTSAIPTAGTTPPVPPPPATAKPASATANPPATAATVRVTRTGGIAGLSETVVIAPDGTWVFTDRRTGATQQGRLTAAQVAQLRQLVSTPDLIVEARRPRSNIACADGITWVVNVGDLTVTEVQCGGGNQPATDAVVRFVTDVTAM